MWELKINWKTLGRYREKLRKSEINVDKILNVFSKIIVNKVNFDRKLQVLTKSGDFLDR